MILFMNSVTMLVKYHADSQKMTWTARARRGRGRRRGEERERGEESRKKEIRIE